jgi:hypothetical protein
MGKILRLLQGSRLITDWERRYPAQETLATIEKRQQSRVAGRLRSLSEWYGLASREISLVAVVKRAADVAGELPNTRVVPVGMPQGMQLEARTNRVMKRNSTPRRTCFIDIASQLEPDGGMPGQDKQQRATRSIAAPYAMISGGHTLSSGAFRSRVMQLVEFLKHMEDLEARQRVIVERTLEAASTGNAPAGPWLKIARRTLVSWDEVKGES